MNVGYGVFDCVSMICVCLLVIMSLLCGLLSIMCRNFSVCCSVLLSVLVCSIVWYSSVKLLCCIGCVVSLKNLLLSVLVIVSYSWLYCCGVMGLCMVVGSFVVCSMGVVGRLCWCRYVSVLLMKFGEIICGFIFLCFLIW